MIRAVSALLAVVACPALICAQSGPYLGVVADPETRLRAGPSDQYPETGALPRGIRVVVQDEEAGWLKIDAPQGQVSWVPTQFIEGFDAARPTPQRVVVSSEGDVTLAAGSAGIAQPLQIRRVKVPNGTLLTIVGPKVIFDGKSWYPVSPPSGDYRYVAKTAIQFEKPANTSFVVRDAIPPATIPNLDTRPGVNGAMPDPSVRQASTEVNPVKSAVNHPLWTQAEAAERDGKYDDAEKLYFELARQMNGSGGDHDIANLCYSRIHSLREKKRGPIAVGTGTPAWSPPKDERTGLLPPSASPGASSTPPKATTPAATNVPSAPSTTNVEGAKWTGPGFLIKAAATVDGRRTYALESSPGIVKAYIVAGANVDLDKHVNRRVDIYGPQTTRRDLSRPLIVAASVEAVGQ